MVVGLASTSSASQGIYGYVYAYADYNYWGVPSMTENSALLDNALVEAYESLSEDPVASTYTSSCGYYVLNLDANQDYIIYVYGNYTSRQAHPDSTPVCGSVVDTEVYYAEEEDVSVNSNSWVNFDIIVNAQ